MQKSSASSLTLHLVYRVDAIQFTLLCSHCTNALADATMQKSSASSLTVQSRYNVDASQHTFPLHHSSAQQMQHAELIMCLPASCKQCIWLMLVDATPIVPCSTAITTMQKWRGSKQEQLETMQQRLFMPDLSWELVMDVYLTRHGPQPRALL